jgi:aromatic ring-cleaving dioxygenase
MRKLTIGMCTYDDFDGVYFTVQSIRMYQTIKNINILVVDNNPSSNSGKATKLFVDSIGGEYVPYEAKKSTSIRNQVFEKSKTKYTACVDSHVLLDNNFVKNLIQYYEENPDSKNIISGPLCNDNFVPYATQFDPIWDHWMYGKWGFNKEKFELQKPFEIGMMGLGVFSCATESWHGFNEAFIGFGGEEGYIHEKFRKYGGKAICVPKLKWVHRFGRPNGPKYCVSYEDRIWNYFIGWLELTKNPKHKMIKEMYKYFIDNYDKEIVDKIFVKAKKQYGF